MARRGSLWVAGALAVAGIIPSCSGDDGNAADDDDDNDTGTGAAPGEFRDPDNDGKLDPLKAGEFGDGAKSISESDVAAMRSSSCTGWTAEPEPMGASLFLVVDASSSMDVTAAGTGERSKWVVTRDALIQTVENFSDDTAIGVLGYPNMVITGNTGDPNECVNIGAMIAPKPLGANDFRQTVVDGLNAIQTETCTPTHDAYKAAVDAYAQAGTIGQKYILLMTDGQPTLLQNCEPGSCSAANAPDGEQYVIDEIQRARDLGIKTFVLGSPGSEEHMETGLDNRWWLSQAAEVGGTALSNCSHEAEPYCHFDMTTSSDFAAALESALATIAGQVVACDYGIPVPPSNQTINAGAINLILRPDGGKPIQLLRTDDPACAQGWYYNSEEERVVLCSESCALAQSDPRLELELMFGCESDVVEIVR